MEIPKEVHVNFLGSYGCGKTSVIRRYFEDVTGGYELKDGPTPSTQSYFKTKEQHPMRLKNSSLKVYDSGHTLGVRDEVGSQVMDAIVVCADITDESSIKMAFLYGVALLPAISHSNKQPSCILCMTKGEEEKRAYTDAELRQANEKMFYPFDSGITKKGIYSVK